MKRIYCFLGTLLLLFIVSCCPNEKIYHASDFGIVPGTGEDMTAKVAAAIESNDDSVKRISAEESRQRGIIESLQPWLELDMPLNKEGTGRTAILLG